MSAELQVARTWVANLCANVTILGIRAQNWERGVLVDDKVHFKNVDMRIVLRNM